MKMEVNETSKKLRALKVLAEEGIEAASGKKKSYAFGQKIPAEVRSFNRQEISNKQFTAKHSSILRILTKWAGYLEEIFDNPEHHIRRRLYSFTNIRN
jgi:tRNA/tmRNA/rRNA uracil-C5-methylase (TrmA/RlmC/RlmD family)